MQVDTPGGNKYFISFIDDLTRKVWIYLVKRKHEILKVLRRFKCLVEKQSGKEKEKQKEQEKNEKNERKGVKKTKSELSRQRKKEAIPRTRKEVSYPLVPSKKDKER